MFPVGTGTCDWNGAELIGNHPGAQMIQCTPYECDFENPYCKHGKEGAYCDMEDSFSDKYVCKSCENMVEPWDCTESVDHNTTTCLQDCFNIETCTPELDYCYCFEGFEHSFSDDNSTFLGCVEISEETTTTQTTTTTSYDYSTEYDNSTDECPECLIPDGVSCDGNIFYNKEGDKIVGGTEVVKNSWPWIAKLGMGCGGSILNKNWILTAAHCCEGRSSVEIIIGAHNGNYYPTYDDSEKVYYAKQIINHPDYNTVPGGLGFDFCLLETTEPMDLDGLTRDIACLPDYAPKENSGHSECFVAGFGTTSSGGGLADNLLSVDVGILADDVCSETVGSGFDPESEFCAGYLSGGKDSCQGDSGGPLVCINDANEPVLTGVVS